jgi:diaminopimelate decarboxylase
VLLVEYISFLPLGEVMREFKPYLNFSLEKVRSNARRFHNSVQKLWSRDSYEVFYAVKANPDPKVLRVLTEEDFGFEVMTNSQLMQISKISGKIIISGFHKNNILLKNANGKILYSVLETPHELDRIIDSEEKLNLALRIKLEADRKIGCDQADIIEILNRVKSKPNITIVGLHFHAGWNIRDSKKIGDYLQELKRSLKILKENGISPHFVNLGGSFCEHSADENQLDERLTLYKEALKNIDIMVHFEPGRYLVGDAGELVTQITGVDQKRKRIFINTCAYGYKITAGTPQARLIVDSLGGEKAIWNIFGYWSAEGDQCSVELIGQPKIGRLLGFNNMGAYTWDLPMQFEFDRGLKVRYKVIENV